MKYLPIDLDERSFSNFKPSKDWFADGLRYGCKTKDAKLLMELFIRVLTIMPGRLLGQLYGLNEGLITFEKAYEELQKQLNDEIKEVSDELAKELITKGKWTSPRFNQIEYEYYHAVFSKWDLKDLPD